MSISTYNFQFYNYKMPASSNAFLNELEMDIDDEMPPVTSTPLPSNKQRFTSELAVALNAPETPKGILPAFQSEVTATPSATALPELRPKLHAAQKRWSMELREKVLEMSKRNNGSDEDEKPQPTPVQNLQSRFMQNMPAPIATTTTTTANNNSSHSSTTLNATYIAAEAVTEAATEAVTDSRSVSDKINFFNKLTNTYESTATRNNHNNNKFISLLRSSKHTGTATTQVPPPKPKRLSATLPLTATPMAAPATTQYCFATPMAKPPSGSSLPRKNSSSTSLRRKPSMDKSRATIARQNSNVTVRPQRHTMMEDLSLVVPVRLRIAEYEQRISMSG